MAHALIFKRCDGRPSGAGGLLAWARFDLAPGHGRFGHVGTGQVSLLAREAVKDAVQRGVDITIAWAPADPLVTPAGELLAMLDACRPIAIICPERPGADRWVTISSGAVLPLAAAAVQRELVCHIEVEYPLWRHGLPWGGSALMLRNSTSAEEMGFIPPRKLTSDDILASIAMDEAVLSANRRDDLHGLAAARLAAQAALGVPEAERAVMYVGQVEDLLAAPLFKVPFDAEATLVMLRRQLRRGYGDLTEIVLHAILRDYPHDAHPNMVLLREAAARETEAA
jgi:hypothetical protein